MWPGFRRSWQRRFNARAIARRVERVLGPRAGAERRVALTTLPITADLMGRIDVDRWLYYCVDDFAVWPGLDGRVLREMELRLVERVDGIVAASRNLQERLSELAPAALRPGLLTHGIDQDHWAPPPGDFKDLANPWPKLRRPIFLFFGLVDRRLDTDWCRQVAAGKGSLVLLGPRPRPDKTLRSLPGVHLAAAEPYEHLPRVAAAADVLVMPYADLPVTQAMQPLKLCEYLATGKPVVVRKFPATDAWRDGADVVSTVEQFVQTARTRVWSGTPQGQLQARRRLEDHRWAPKALDFEALLLGRSIPEAAAA